MKLFSSVFVLLALLSGCSSNSIKLDLPDGIIPQGFKSYENRYYMSAHDKDKASYIYDVNLQTGSAKYLFKMPDDATHTSGICFDGNYIVAVDYNSDKIYRIDLDKSIKEGRAHVLNIIPSDLKGTSACEIVAKDNFKYFLISDFRNTKKTYIVDYEKMISSNEMVSSVISSYSNNGFSQGLLYHDNKIYESGNSWVGFSRVISYDFNELLNNKNTGVSKFVFAFGIQDMVAKEGKLYFPDEVDFKIHELNINSF